VPTPYFSSTYRILGGAHPSLFYQPKGVPTPSHNFSGSGGK
jgi:hypothetical protein